MKKRHTTILTILGLSIFFLAFLNSSRLWVRFDLTEDKAYTLSKASKELFKEIDEQVTITYYLSEKLSSKHPMPGEISDLLREYAAHSRGRIRVVIKDPLKTDTVAAAERLGVMPQQIETVEQDESSIATVYTGLVLEYLDKTDAIPVVFSLDKLEYDLTSRIRALVRGKKPELGFLVGSELEWDTDFSYLAQNLAASSFDIRQLKAGDEIPDSLAAVVILGGVNDFDDWAAYRLDRYIRIGGKVLFAVEGVSVAYKTDLMVNPAMDSRLLDLLKNYGVTVEPALSLDKTSLVLTYQTQSANGFLQYRRIRYPLWPALNSRYASSDHPLTASFDGLDLFWSSPLNLVETTGVQAEVLAKTSPEAWQMTKNFYVSPDLESLFYGELAETKGSQNLVVALNGTFPSPYADKPKPIREGSSETLPDTPIEAKESRILIVGDADFASNLIQNSGSGRNIDFMMAALDWLSNDDDILAIRTRTNTIGRLDRIADPDKRASYTMLVQIVNLVLVPLALIAFGILRAWKRRSRNRALRETNDAISA